MKKLLVVMFFLASAAATPAMAAVPDTISFQGRLTDSSGALLNGIFSVTLRIYTAPTGGAALWTENQPSVPVVNGIHNMYLGNSTSLAGLAFDQPYWISIEVNGGGEMTPRRPMTTAPYAFRARYADTATALTGLNWINPMLPQGFSGTPKNILINAGASYTVPANKALYVFWAGATLFDSGSLRIDGQPYNGGANDSGLPLLGPVIVASNSTIDFYTYNQAGISVLPLAGFVSGVEMDLDSSILFKNLLLSNSSAYTVPAGKTLFITRAIGVPLATGNSAIRINGFNAIRLLQKSGAIALPLIITGGSTLDIGDTSVVHITGYER